MHFLTLIALQVLLVAGIASAADTPDESMLRIATMILCEPEFKEVQDAMEQCTTEKDYSSDNELWKKCGVEIISSDMLGIQEYYCNTPLKMLVKDNQCFTQQAADSGKEDEMAKRNKRTSECIKSVMESRKRK